MNQPQFQSSNSSACTRRPRSYPFLHQRQVQIPAYVAPSVTPRKRSLEEENIEPIMASQAQSSMQHQPASRLVTTMHDASQLQNSSAGGWADNFATRIRDSFSPESKDAVTNDDEYYFDQPVLGPDILPAVMRSLGTVFRWGWKLTSFGTHALQATIGDAKRRMVERGVPWFTKGREGIEAGGPEGAGEAQTEREKQQIRGRRRDVDDIWRGRHPRHARDLTLPQRDHARRTRKSRRRPGEAGEITPPAPSPQTIAHQKKLQRKKERKALQEQRQRERNVQVQPTRRPTAEEKQKEMEKSIWGWLSEKSKKDILEGKVHWRSPAEEEQEAKENIPTTPDKGKLIRLDYPAITETTPRPLYTPQRVLVEATEDLKLSDEEEENREDKSPRYRGFVSYRRTLEKEKKKPKAVHWWQSLTPLGRPISSTKLYEQWSRVLATPEPEGPSLKPVSAKWRRRVESAMRSADYAKVATTMRGEPLTRRDLFTCYRQAEWLNDEVINAYLALIVDYAKKHYGSPDTGKTANPRFHAFNSFFFSNLRDKGYDSVKRWASRAKIGGEALLAVDTVFVPVHHHAHWTLMVIRPMERTIEHFDSLGTWSRQHVACAKRWLAGELKGKYKEEEWEVKPTRSPQQNNSSDCGVFLLTSAKMKMLGRELEYGPSDIPEIRRRIVAELINGSLEGDFEEEGEGGDESSSSSS